MELYLGVDGGGRGCAVGDGRGRKLGGAGAAKIWTGFEQARDNILVAARATLAGAGAAGRASRATRRPHSGARSARPTGWRRRWGPVRSSGRGAGSGVRMIGGWGFLLGDHASGARLGRALCEAALLAHGGLAPGSSLFAAAKTSPSAFWADSGRCSRSGWRRATGRRSPSRRGRGSTGHWRWRGRCHDRHVVRGSRAQRDRAALPPAQASDRGGIEGGEWRGGGGSIPTCRRTCAR
jgi:hypothetical protein